jgi:hypothetical protein
MVVVEKLVQQVLVVCLESKGIKARHRLLVLRFMVSKVIEDSREQLGRLGLRAHLETMEFQDYQVKKENLQFWVNVEYLAQSDKTGLLVTEEYLASRA